MSNKKVTKCGLQNKTKKKTSIHRLFLCLDEEMVLAVSIFLNHILFYICIIYVVIVMAT